jgi:hypothetical protein
MKPFIMFLPMTWPPAAATRGTTVATVAGMNPSSPCEVNTWEIPATRI